MISELMDDCTSKVIVSIVKRIYITRLISSDFVSSVLIYTGSAVQYS